MNGIVQKAGKFIKRNGATILTIAGGVGVVVTTVTAIKATPKALERLEEAKQEKGEPLTKWEKVKVAGPTYLPTMVIGAGTVMCVIGVHLLTSRTQANVASAYALVEQSYRAYRNKVIELYGQETHEEIVDAIAAERAKNVGVNAPGFVGSNTLYVDERCGRNRLFYDEFGDRFFETTLEQVISAQYHLNRNYCLRGYSVLNEFYDFLGLEPTDHGDELGWCAYDDGTFWVEFNNRQTEINGQECIVIEMPYAPDLEWKDYYCY